MVELKNFDYTKLEQILVERGIKQLWVTNKVGVYKAYYRDARRSKRDPSLPVWLATSLVLEVPPEHFVKSL